LNQKIKLMIKMKVFALMLLFVSCECYDKIIASNNSKNNSFPILENDTISERKINGYFLFYRESPKKTEHDVTVSKEIYDVFYLKNSSLNVGNLADFVDSLLLDTMMYISVSPVYSGVWSPLKSEKDTVLKYLEKKYPFSILQQYNFHGLIGNAIPKEFIESDKPFLSIFNGELQTTKTTYSAEHNFSNTTEKNFGTWSTYLLLPNSENRLQYKFSILLK
jgi:hypothetical protein